MKTLGQFLEEAKATYCGRCGTRHVPPPKGGTCPELKEEALEESMGNIYIKKSEATHQTDATIWPDSDHPQKIETLYHRTEGEVKNHIKSLKKKYGAANVKVDVKKLREGYVPTADEPTEHDKKMAQKVRDLLAKEKKPIKEDVVAQINDLVRQRNAAKSPIARKNLETQINRLKRQQRKMNEDLDLEEAVEVSHDRYRSSHGKKASGPGAWMFTHKRSGEATGDDTFTAPATARSFTDAAKHAKAWAKSKGHRTVYVMEETEIEDAGTRNEFRKQKIVHRGEHVATIHTYRGRAGGWVPSAHTPDGNDASKKYGIDLTDTKKKMISKIKNYHKGN